jgi:MraZ protein
LERSDLFTGQYDHSIDDKGRLAIPARFRADLAEGLYLTAGVDRCLHVLTPQAWQVMAEGIAGLPWPNPDVRQAQRNVFAMAVHLVPDKLGRIVIPQYLRSYAVLGTDVVVAGVFERLEIWDRAAWQQLRANFMERGVELVQGLTAFVARPDAP